MKFDKHLSNSTAEAPVKFQTDRINPTQSLRLQHNARFCLINRNRGFLNNKTVFEAF